MDQNLQQAILLHEAGHLQDAERLYLDILRSRPDHAEASHNLARLYAQAGRPDIALPHFSTALEAAPDHERFWRDYIDALLLTGNAGAAAEVFAQASRRGLRGEAMDALAGRLEESRALNAFVDLFAAGRYAAAEPVARAMTIDHPRFGMGWKALGVVLLHLGRIADAVPPMRQAAALLPGDAEAQCNLGAALQELGQLAEAEAGYRRALEIHPDHVEAHSNLGATLKSQGRLAEAEASCRRALALQPDHVEALGNLGGILREQGRLADAEASYRRGLGIRPDFYALHSNLGRTLSELGRLEEAVASFRRAVELRPDSAEACSNLGFALLELGRQEESEACFRRALKIDPDLAEVHVSLGMLQHKQLRMAEAKSSFDRALALQPGLFRAQLCATLGTIPILYATPGEIDLSRRDYAAALERLANWYRHGGGARNPEAWRDVGYMQHFYLAYQGRNDRELQESFGGLMHEVMAAAFTAAAVSPPVSAEEPDGRLRIGIVSAYFRDHSNWKIPVRGWVEHLDRSRFRLLAYHTGAAVDAETERARRGFDRFHDKRSVPEFRKAILADKPDVLIYPGLGMDQDSWQLAALRLAPVQCTSWGHPVTSGLPTIDYFLSSDLMEPAEADAHYSEQLVRLPNLSIHYTLPDVRPLTPSRSEFGLAEDATVYFCPQSLQKYLPQNDALLVEIARRVPRAKFAFLGNAPAAVSAFLMDRLRRAFAQAGLAADDHLALLPALDSDQFQAASQIADVLLDTPDWSGCNSSLELLAHGLPVVTLPGEFMRGRHTLAILRMMGLEELIASSAEHYVALAVRLATDAAWRRAVRERIAASYPRVCGDLAPVRALEQFLVDAVARQRVIQGQQRR